MSYPFAPKEKINFSREMMTIEEFILNYQPITDCNPIGQRPAVYLSPQNDKSVAIIMSILHNIDVGNITLVDVKDEPTKWLWESLDGGHRKRAIIDFRNGEFKVMGMYYSEFPDDLKQLFLSYTLSFTLYEPLSNYMKGVIFRSLNKTTDVNSQETLNSYGDHPIANAVRETVRIVSKANGKTTITDDVFAVTAGGNFKWIEGDNLRLKQEEWVARVYYSFYNGGKLGNRESDRLETMYNDDTINMKQLKRKVDKFLEFLFEMAKSRRGTMGTGLSNSEKTALLNTYLYLSDSYGSDLEATDYLAWYQAFSKVYNDLYHDPQGKYKDIIDLPFESKETTISQRFKDYTRNHNSIEKQTQLVMWLTNHSEWENVLKHTLLKDRNRSFPRWMKEVTLQNQGYVCYIDGLPLSWDEAEAGHIVAHAKQGKTVLDNCAMIRKCYNSDMGTMDVNEYKEHWANQQKAAA